MNDGLKEALGATSIDNKNVFPELFEAFTVSDTVLLHDKFFTYVRPTNQSAYNELSETPIQTGAIRCEIGTDNSPNESKSIAKGTRVLVIKPHPAADIGYILKILGRATAEEETSKDLVSDGSFNFRSEGAGIHIDGKRNLATIFTTNKNEVMLTESEGSMTVGASQLKLNTKAFKVDTSLSSLDLQKDVSILSSGRITIGAGFYDIEATKKDIDLLGSGLNVDVSGGTFDIKAKNITSNQLIRHDEIGAKYSINIGTNLINPVAGLLDTTSFDLNVLSGDINIHTTTGGLFLHASNILQKDSIKLVTGLAVRKAGFMQGIPPYSSIDSGGIKGIRMEVIGAGADTFFLGPNNITMSTTGPITATATLNGILTSGVNWLIVGGASPLIEPPAMGLTLTQILTFLVTELSTHVHPTAVGPSGPSITGAVTASTILGLLPQVVSKGVLIN
jgi:hypothetical protein